MSGSSRKLDSTWRNVHKGSSRPSSTIAYGEPGGARIDGRRHDVESGQLMVVPRLTPHAYGSTEQRPWTLYWFHAMGANIDQVLSELGIDRARPVVDLGRDMRLIELFEELQQGLEQDVAWPTLLYASQLLTHLVGLIIRLARAHPRLPDARQRVLASAAAMKAHLHQPVDTAKLAALSYLSPSHYSALFHRLLGAPPRQYLNQLRIHHAAQLLGTTHDDIQEIARRVGFDDPLYFSRAFRRLQGVSPSEYRLRRKLP
ncbi:MAG: AraC family transcriptional regulator [Polyangiaceae bacterium]